MADSLDEGLISFAAGFPPKDLLPVDALRRSLARVLRKQEGATHLGYAPTGGATALTAEIERVPAARGLTLSDDDVLVVTEGAQRAFSLCLEQFFESRGALAVESPGYVGIIAACRRRGIPMVPVAVDRGGMNPTAAARAFGRSEVRGLYTLPTFQNPTGVTRNLMRRKRILSLAKEREAILIEDDTYADLRLGGKPTIPIKAPPDSERVIYVGSFSKSLALGLQLGFLVAKGALGWALLHLKETVDISTGMLRQAAAADFLSSGGYRRHLTAVKKAYRSRRLTMLTALERHLGDRVRIYPPRGELHLYVMFAHPVCRPSSADPASLLSQN